MKLDYTDKRLYISKMKTKRKFNDFNAWIDYVFEYVEKNRYDRTK